MKHYWLRWVWIPQVVKLNEGMMEMFPLNQHWIVEVSWRISFLALLLLLNVEDRAWPLSLGNQNSEGSGLLGRYLYWEDDDMHSILNWDGIIFQCESVGTKNLPLRPFNISESIHWQDRNSSTYITGCLPNHIYLLHQGKRERHAAGHIWWELLLVGPSYVPLPLKPLLLEHHSLWGEVGPIPAWLPESL